MIKLSFHCAILSTKVQQLRNQDHLEEGDCIWQGGPILATKSLVWEGQIWQLKVVWADHFSVGLLLA